VDRRFITSEQNPDIKRIKALRDRRAIRYAERRCVVEGPRFIADAAQVAQPLLLAVAESYAEQVIPDTLDIILVPDALFARISDTESPQGLLAVFPFPEIVSSPNIPDLIIYADAIRDPGNLGTLIRSAAALGATSVICGRGTTDPYGPKAIRAAGAAQWQIAIHVGEDLSALATGVQIVIADGSAETTIDEIDFGSPVCIVVGSEGAGISPAIRDLPHIATRIPITDSVDSLNAGVAASIVLYEARRQRHSRGQPDSGDRLRV
jgi:TrmH family RNA methyltransferase